MTVNAIVSGPVSGATIDAGALNTGGRSTLPTWSVTTREPWSALVAVNVTVYVPESANVGVQASVPDVAPSAAVNGGAPPGGIGETAAVRLAIASPSASAALTASENGAPSVS